MNKLKSILGKFNSQTIAGLVVILVITVAGVYLLVGSHAQSPYASNEAGSGMVTPPATVQQCANASEGKCVQFGATPTSFNYGFDFSDQEPDPSTQDTQALSNDPAAVASALGVLSKFSGSMMDQSINGFGAQQDPQLNPVQAPTLPNSSNTNLSSIASRLQLISNAGGVPAITLITAPTWMHQAAYCPNGDEASMNGNEDTNITTPGVNLFALPPCPDNYQNFANLAAYIAQSFPQVKYFVVWSEVREFYNPAAKSYDAASYTDMYNDVYTAIKKVRPNAMVGGPYAIMSATACLSSSNNCSTLSPISGSYGYVNADMTNVLSYWLKNKVSADFIAMDGGTEITTANNNAGDSTITDPVTASEKFAAVDQWVQKQSGYNNLPIWWMESHIAPTTGWTDAQGAAARIATLALMNSSGASVGMQWQPQEQSNWPDEGLWTSTEAAGGGQPTILANELAPILPVITQRLSLVSGQPMGVLAATEGAKLLLVNTNNANATALVNNISINLSPGDVEVENIP